MTNIYKSNIYFMNKSKQIKHNCMIKKVVLEYHLNIVAFLYLCIFWRICRDCIFGRISIFGKFLFGRIDPIGGILSRDIPSGTLASSPAQQLIGTIRAARAGGAYQ